MAIIPLRQSVLIYKPDSVNDWGETTPKDPIKLKCRVDEKIELVKNISSSQLGDEVISNVQILFDRLPDISYEDTLEFTNELGVEMTGKPLLIEPIRMPNGKPTLTTVYL